MLLEGSDQLHLRAAADYIELAMFEETNAELEEIGIRTSPAFSSSSPMQPGVVNQPTQLTRF